MKIFNDKQIRLPRLNEDIWFDVHQELLLSMANTKFGRDLLCIPQEYPQIFLFKKNCVHYKNADGSCTADFRIGSKWANIIRYRWTQFNSYARYFQFPRVILSTMELEMPFISPLVRASIRLTASTLTAYPDPGDPGTNSMDASFLTANADYATAHNAMGADTVEGTNTSIYCQNSGTYSIRRIGASWNTSTLTSLAIISAATVSYYGLSRSFANAQNIYLVTFAPASKIDFVLADYAQANWGTSSIATATISTGSWADSAYNTYTLSSVSSVNKTTATAFGLRLEDDINSTTRAGQNLLEIASADTTGTSKDPKLIVTYVLAPADPSALTATASNGSQNITLNWTDNSSTETSFRIERSNTGSGGWAEIDSVGAGVQTYVDSSIAAYSTTRYYRVRAYDGVTYSGYTSTANATTASSPPTIGTATASNGSSSLVVTFTDTSSDETNFRVEASANGSTGWSEVGTPTVSPYTHALALFDTTRYYRVRAFRTSDGIYSAYSSVSNAATTAPAAPTSFAVSISGVTPTLTWTDNSSTETTFSIERKKTSAGAYSEIATDTASPYADTAIPQTDAIYYYKIRAYRSTDGIYSAYASEQSVVVPPEAPTVLQAACTVVNGNSSKVQLSWAINSLTETGFLVEKSTDGSSWSTVTTVGAGIAAYEVTGLTNATTYYFRITTVGTNGSSSPCASVSIKTSRGLVADLLLAFDKKIRHFPN